MLTLYRSMRTLSWLTVLLLLCQHPQQSRLAQVSAFSLVHPQSHPSQSHHTKVDTRLFTSTSPLPPKTAAASSRKPTSKAVDAVDSNRLKKARLRLAEAQGLLPFGATESISLEDLTESDSNSYLQSLTSATNKASRVREISWRVAEPEVKYTPVANAKKLVGQPMRWLKRNAQIFIPISLFFIKVLKDIVLRQEEANRGKRAKQLLQIISSQSPALIKAGKFIT